MTDLSKVKEDRVNRLKVYQEKVKSGEIIPTPPKTPKEKWEDNKTSLRASVNYMCWQCFGGDDGDNVKKEIKECSAKDCALWNVRPYK